MRIQLNHNYRGLYTDNQWIVEGVYEDDDPGLHGLADYLIENGHAVALDDPPPPADDPAEPPADDDREAIKAALDAQGIDYNNRWATERLHSLLTDS